MSYTAIFTYNIIKQSRKMDNKQKEQMKKGLVFGGLGLLFALSMWFIFAPSGKDKTAAEQGLNDSIPQATTEKLTENKLKAYELGDKAHEEEQAREEIFCERISAAEVQRSQQSQVECKNEIFYGAKNPLRRYILRQKLQIQRYSATHFDCDDFIAARLKKIAAANKVLALLALPKIAAYKIYRKFA